MTHDTRKTPSWKLPQVAAFNPYILKREKIHSYDLINFPFLTPINGTQYRVSNYEFMSVLTNGAINPHNTARRTISGNSVLSIIFNDNEEFVIRGETPNIPLINKQWIQVYNELSGGQSEQEGLETGYGELFIFLHNYPYEWSYLKKNNPHFCGTTGILASQESKGYWIGVDKLNTTDTLLIPFVPSGYEFLHLCANGTLKNFQIQIYQYMNSKCPALTELYPCEAMYDGTDLGICTSFYNCTDRIRLVITNLDTEDDDIYFHGFFTGKSDNY